MQGKVIHITQLIGEEPRLALCRRTVILAVKLLGFNTAGRGFGQMISRKTLDRQFFRAQSQTNEVFKKVC